MEPYITLASTLLSSIFRDIPTDGVCELLCYGEGAGGRGRAVESR